MQLADEGLVRIGAAIEQAPEEVQGGERVGVIGPQSRAIARSHIRRRIVHVDGEVERPFARVGPQVEQHTRQVEAIVDDGDGHGGDAVAVGQSGIGAACDQRPDDRFVSIARGVHQRGEAAGRMI
jgi:hypothetical protein